MVSYNYSLTCRHLFSSQLINTVQRYRSKNLLCNHTSKLGQGKDFEYPFKMVEKEQLSFKSKDELNEIESVHEGKKSFECDVCFAVLKSKVGLETYFCSS